MSKKTIIEVAGQPSVCRRCGNRLDAATHMENDAAIPRPGDVSVCMYCLTWSIYDDDLSLRPPRDRAERRRINSAKRELEEQARERMKN